MKIQIKDKGFLTTHYGYFLPGGIYTVSDSFGKYCAFKMDAATVIEEKPKQTIVKKKSVKKAEK